MFLGFNTGDSRDIKKMQIAMGKTKNHCNLQWS